jgi:hypothetical protein
MYYNITFIYYFSFISGKAYNIILIFMIINNNLHTA